MSAHSLPVWASSINIRGFKAPGSFFISERAHAWPRAGGGRPSLTLPGPGRKQGTENPSFYDVESGSELTHLCLEWPVGDSDMIWIICLDLWMWVVKYSAIFYKYHVACFILCDLRNIHFTASYVKFLLRCGNLGIWCSRTDQRWHGLCSVSLIRTVYTFCHHC